MTKLWGREVYDHVWFRFFSDFPSRVDEISALKSLLFLPFSPTTKPKNRKNTQALKDFF
jgi:hypothetical protein